MAHITKSALVMHSARQMFDLVNNVESYPDFLPWCSARLLSRSEQEVCGELEVSRAGIQQNLPRTVVLLLAALALWFGALAPAPLPAAEVDSVTSRLVMLDDSMATVNAIFQQRLEEGIADANPDADDIGNVDADAFCDPDRLYRSVRRAMFDSFLPRWGLRGYDLDRQLRELLAADSYVLSLQDSIYRDIDFLEGISLNLKKLSDVVRLDGHLVGLDKLGHFFAEGWTYFDKTHADGETLEEAMAWGSEQESGKFGYTTTGIHSFADLVANFQGWRFWNALLGTHNDPLKSFFANSFSEPYVECEIELLDSLRHHRVVRAWHLNRRFDLSDYVDGAWDENNNCNSYADPVIEQKVATRIDEIAPGFVCPVEPAACVEARQRYGRFAKQLLHPRCLTSVNGGRGGHQEIMTAFVTTGAGEPIGEDAALQEAR